MNIHTGIGEKLSQLDFREVSLGSNAYNPISQTMLSGIIWFRQGDGKQGDSGRVKVADPRTGISERGRPLFFFKRYAKMSSQSNFASWRWGF